MDRKLLTSSPRRYILELTSRNTCMVVSMMSKMLMAGRKGNFFVCTYY